MHVDEKQKAALQRAEEAFRASEVRYRTLFDYAPDGIVIADAQGYYLDANPSACRMLGYARDEFIRLHSSNVVAPEELGHIEPALRALKSTPDYHREWRLRRKDGTIFPAEVIGTATPDGNILALIRDITERKRAEEALAAEQALLRTIFDVLPDYIYVKDRASRFLACNQPSAHRLGVASREDLIGKSDADFFPPEVAAAFRAEELAVLQGAAVIDREERFTRPDGVSEVILTSKLPLRDGAGNIVGIVGTGRDITERKGAEEAIRRLNAELEQRVAERTAQLEAANKDLESFSYSVSHDLRAPLRAVDGFSQAVIEDFGPQLPAEGQRQLQTIRQSAQRMGELIDDLLSFSRLGRQSLSRHAVDTEQLVHSALADLAGETAGREVQITVGALPSCHGDPALLRQVWINLLANALKYSHRRTPAVIEVGCVQQAGENVFFVRDNGVGFEMKYADKLFGVFQRLHRADEYPGTGVGLAIVHRVVSRHGGRVWAEAEPDRGATFSFTLEPQTHP